MNQENEWIYKEIVMTRCFKVKLCHFVDYLVKEMPRKPIF